MASDEITPISADSYSSFSGQWSHDDQVSDDSMKYQGGQLHSPVTCEEDQGGPFTSNQRSELMDRKNEFYSLKRFVLISLGIPRTPAMKDSYQRVCTCAAILFYALLFIWGIILVGISTIADGYLWKFRCPDFVPARIFTILAGVFYILLGIYWVLLCWWNICYQPYRQTHHKSFSTMAFLWWLLCIYFTVIATALAIQVVQYRNVILSTGISKADNFVDCGGHASSSSSETDVIHVPNNLVPAWALGSMLILVLVNFCTFITNAITLYRM